MLWGADKRAGAGRAIVHRCEGSESLLRNKTGSKEFACRKAWPRSSRRHATVSAAMTWPAVSQISNLTTLSVRFTICVKKAAAQINLAHPAPPRQVHTQANCLSVGDKEAARVEARSEGRNTSHRTRTKDECPLGGGIDVCPRECASHCETTPFTGHIRALHAR